MSSNIVIVSVSGLKGCGKDTFAQKLKKELELYPTALEVYISSLADPLKELIQKTYYLNRDELEELKRDESKLFCNGLTMRQLLINFSENLKDLFGSKALWVDRLWNKFSKQDYKIPTIIIIPDVRYPEEQRYLRKLENYTKIKKYVSVFLNLKNHQVNLDKGESFYDKLKYDFIVKGTHEDFDKFVVWFAKELVLLLRGFYG